MGTIGSVSQINDFKNEYILITNADVITKINYEKFFLDFESKNADLSMITIPYSINIPYGVTSIKTDDNSIVSLDEKPKYTHYCNAGIYLLKKSVISEIPKNKHYNTTDLVKKLIKNKFKVISYPTHDYWMDIGSIEDYKQANEDIKNL
jgi:NDP-sugar pyrophosphorylase family protein